MRAPRVDDKSVDDATRGTDPVLPDDPACLVPKPRRSPRCCRCCTCMACPPVTACTCGSTGSTPRSAGITMAFKLIESPRPAGAVNAPLLVALVRAGAEFKNGKLVETTRRIRRYHFTPPEMPIHRSLTIFGPDHRGRKGPSTVVVS